MQIITSLPSHCMFSFSGNEDRKKGEDDVEAETEATVISEAERSPAVTHEPLSSPLEGVKRSLAVDREPSRFSFLL